MPFSLRRTAQLAIISAFLVQNHPPSPNSNHCIILFCTANRIFSRFYASNSHGTATERKQRTEQKKPAIIYHPLLFDCSTLLWFPFASLPVVRAWGLINYLLWAEESSVRHLLCASLKLSAQTSIPPDARTHTALQPRWLYSVQHKGATIKDLTYFKCTSRMGG